MLEEPRVEYGTPGTPLLGCEEVERAIDRLDEMWQDTIAPIAPTLGAGEAQDVPRERDGNDQYAY